MKIKPTTLTALAFSLLGISSAWSADKFLGNGGDNWLEHVRAQRAASMTPVNKTPALFGNPAPVALASRTITLTPGMKHVTVDSGETVAFKAGNKTVGTSWRQSADGPST